MNDKKINWLDFNSAIKKANKENQFVLLYIHTDWCRNCKLIDKTVLTDERVREVINENYIPATLDPEDETKDYKINEEKFSGKNVINKFNILSIPILVILKPNGRPVARITGYNPPDEVLKALRYASEKYELS